MKSSNECYLFRGKRLDNGEWVQGHYVYFVDHCTPNGKHEIYVLPDAEDADCVVGNIHDNPDFI